ncbi:hypothetical protein WR25_05916 [Diploscapter pachys]|uniref:Uncharacterized protein n=1 Tax=Diploscapter pachys TaxID=2018661 RepID=A0A2A2KV69_9BILA|nr:hypothetical protein WR25_05916 [Diploscapter pachys]
MNLGTSNSAMKYPAFVCLTLLELISLIAADFYGQTIPGIRIRHPTHYRHSQIRRAPLSHRTREGDDNNEDYENSDSSPFGTDDEENRHRRKYNRLKVIREREINGIPIRFNSDYEQYEDTSEERINGAKGPRNLKVNIQSLDSWDEPESVRRALERGRMQQEPTGTDMQELKTEMEEIEDTLDLFEAMRLEKPDICEKCPKLFLPQNESMATLCSNYNAISTFFSMGIDERRGDTEEWSDNEKCTLKITCSQPHMLVKWKDSEVCDVHAPTEGDRTFVYTCQNGQWTMHNFPISGVICGLQFE